MKKLFTFVLAAAAALCLVSCGNKNEADGSQTTVNEPGYYSLQCTGGDLQYGATAVVYCNQSLDASIQGNAEKTVKMTPENTLEAKNTCTDMLNAMKCTQQTTFSLIWTSADGSKKYTAATIVRQADV